MNHRLLLSALVIGLCLPMMGIQAATVYFDNNAGDLKYETTGNWYDGSTRYLPAAGHDGIIAGYNATLSSDVSASVPDNLYLGYINSAFPTVSGDGALTLDNAAASLSVGALRLGYSDHATTQSNGTINLQAGALTLGGTSYIGQGGGAAGGNGTINQTGGAFSAKSLYLGHGANSSGTYNISGSGTTANLGTSSFYLGYNEGAYGEISIGTNAGSDAPSVSAASCYVGYGYSGATASGKLTLQGAGSLNLSSTLQVGGPYSSGAAASGEMFIKDSASLDTTSSAYIGNYGTGTVYQTGGSATYRSYLYIGSGSTGTGTYNISAGSLVTTNAARSTYIRGDTSGSEGSINVSGTADVDLATRLVIGRYTKGKYAQSGGTTDVTNQVCLGYSTGGNGTLNISGGSFDSHANNLYVGYSSGAAGHLILDGASTTLSTGEAYVGGNTTTTTTAQGDVLQKNGSFSASKLHLGYAGTGEYDMQGGTLTVSGSAYVGQGSSATGTMTQSGGTFTAAGGMNIGHSGTGTYTISGGSFDNHVNPTDTFNTVVGNNGTGDGTLNVQSTGSFSTRELDVAFYAGSEGAVYQTGGTINASSAFIVGVYGTGSYELSGGTATSAGGFILGYADGGSGTFTISNNAEYNSGGSFTVGGSGDGVAYINGGTVNAAGAVGVSHSSTSSGVVTQTAGSVNTVWMLIGDGTGSDGEYNMSGGDVNLTWQLLVGNKGVGRMNLSGGTVNADENVQIGNESAGQGTLTQTGGAINADMLCVGNNGTGTFNYTGGTTAITGNTYIGRGDSSTGTLNFGIAGNTLTTRSLFAASSQVAGTGSINTNGLVSDENLVFDSTASLTQTLNWGSVAVNLDLTKGIDNGSLGAGWRGTGSVTITNGVTVNSERGYLGYRTGSTGTATVSGGATWNVGDLTVGRDGTGTLNIDNGTVNLFGGDVDGSGTFNFKAGTLKNVGEVSTAVNLQTGGSGAVFQQEAGYAGLVSGGLSGGGTLTKTGEESLTLTGANTYTGQTIVQQGSLVLGSNAQGTVLTGGGADIQAGKMVFDYAGGSTPAATLGSLLAASYNGGAWDVGQFLCSTADATFGLGWMDDSVDEAVTVMYTAYGDADLSGVVGTSDLSVVLANFGQAGAWSDGDFDYSGIVGTSDLSVVLANFGQALPLNLDITGYELDGEAIGALNAAGINTVPEPSTVVLLLAGLVALLGYAWRKRG